MRKPKDLRIVKRETSTKIDQLARNRNLSPETYINVIETFECAQLICDLVRGFAKIPAERIDSEIRSGIRRLVEGLSFDRGALCQLSADESHLIYTHQWSAPKVSPLAAPPGPLPAQWVYRQILSGRTVAFSRIEDLPEEASEDKRFFRSMGTKSHISLPMEIDGSVIGAIVLESIDMERTLPDQVAGKLRSVADVFAGAVERRRRKLELLERLRFESLLNDISARFVKLEPGEIDLEIEGALRQITELFHGDRCAIVEIQLDGKHARVTHAWYAEGIEPVSGELSLVPMFPWAYQMLVVQGLTVYFSNLAELPPEAEQDRQSWISMGIRSAIIIPLFTGKSVRHIIAFHNMCKDRFSPREYIPRLRLLGETFVNALMRKESEEKLRKSYQEIQVLKDKLQVEAEYLRSEIKLSQSHEKIIGQSEALVKVLKLAEQVAPTDSTVLVTGETGTGKELIARSIHSLSPYGGKVMVKVNCASLPAPLVESELFGREKGAYTGALTRQIGRFEMADGSSIFLDEISELSLELQAKLLRVLQEGQFERLGSPKTIQVSVRIIAATNRDLAEEVKKGNFREDLFYRLNVFPIKMPPLRQRTDDIPMLVWAFINEFGERMGKKINKVTRRDMEALQRYGWPGNIRELRNVIEYAVIVSHGDTLVVKVPKDNGNEITCLRTLNEVESQYILEVLRHTRGHIKGPYGAASILGINPSTLYSRIEKLGIKIHKEKGDISS